jgi:hypothetical protein
MSTYKDDNWHSETLPTWCAVEAYRRDDQYDWSFRVGIRCRDADVKILDISPRVMHEPGRTPRISMTKEALLQAIHEQVTVELAKLALEKE